MAAPTSEKTLRLALCLPLFGLFLLMPPALLVFGIPTTIAGVPLIVLYIFGVWCFLIAGAYLLTRRLDPDAPVDRPAAGADRFD
jgi:hypothetical protein